ncbi:hypothetical protein V6V47_30390 [Micromonospora sp. CPCC 205539]|uniref:hypothetical protein n=1 Tax=Micromonospora sp. CPCC 205539 TaxID=3122408 RepID=UPI002FF2F06C
MTVRSIRRPLLTIGLIVAGATLAVTPSASASAPLRAAALADGAPLTAVALGGTGKIDASGAAVFVPVSLTCSQPTQVDLTVKVAQAIGESVRTGTTTRKVPCDATTQKVRIAVTATELPFAPGVAFGAVTGNSCDALCNSLTDEHRFELAL